VEQVFIALVSVVIGAVLTAALQYSFWKRQHREEQKSLEEREVRRERALAAERFREVARLLIEINCEPRNPQTDVTTATLLEKYRLRRELIVAATAVRDSNILKGERLNIFLRMTETLSPQSAPGLRSELDAIVAELRADVSISDK
jgi:hypothetical protein